MLPLPRARFASPLGSTFTATRGSSYPGPRPSIPTIDRSFLKSRSLPVGVAGNSRSSLPQAWSSTCLDLPMGGVVGLSQSVRHRSTQEQQQQRHTTATRTPRTGRPSNSEGILAVTTAETREPVEAYLQGNRSTQEFLDWWRNFFPKPTIRDYYLAMSSVVERGEFDTAISLFKELESNFARSNLRFRPKAGFYTALFYSLAMQNRFGELKSYWDKMKAERVPLRPFMFRFLEKSHRSDDMNQMNEYLEEMLQAGFRPRPAIIYSMLKGYARAGQLDRLVARYEQFTSPPFDVHPDQNLLFPLILGFSLAGKPDQVVHWFLVWKDKGFTPNVAIYTYVIQPLMAKKRFEEAVPYVQEMLNSGLPLSVKDYGVALQVFAEAGQLDSMLNLFHRLLSDTSLVPTERVFSNLLYGFSKAGKTNEMLHWYQVMRDKGIEPVAISTYNSLVKGLLQANKPDEALQFLEAMLSKNKTIPGEVFSSLLTSCATAGQLETMVKIYRRVEPVVEPRGQRGLGSQLGSRMGRILKLTKDEAAAVLDQMREKGIASFDEQELKTILDSVERGHSKVTSNESGDA